MGDESSTAQVHPQKLSRALVDAAQEKGAQLRIGEVQNIITSGKKVTGKPHSTQHMPGSWGHAHMLCATTCSALPHAVHALVHLAAAGQSAHACFPAVA